MHCTTFLKFLAMVTHYMPLLTDLKTSFPNHYLHSRHPSLSLFKISWQTADTTSETQLPGRHLDLLTYELLWPFHGIRKSHINTNNLLKGIRIMTVMVQIHFRVETFTMSVLFKGCSLVNRWMRHLKFRSSHPLLLLPPTPSPGGFLSLHSLTCCSHSEAQREGCTYTHQHV